MIVTLAAAALATQKPETIMLWHPPSASNVVKTVEARCGPNRYQITWSPINRGRSEQILSLARDDVQFSPVEVGKIFGKDRFMIVDASFGTCIIKDDHYTGVRLILQLAYPLDEKLHSRDVALIASSIVPED